jgi:hypothetical protein
MAQNQQMAEISIDEGGKREDEANTNKFINTWKCIELMTSMLML